MDQQQSLDQTALFESKVNLFLLQESLKTFRVEGTVTLEGSIGTVPRRFLAVARPLLENGHVIQLLMIPYLFLLLLVHFSTQLKHGNLKFITKHRQRDIPLEKFSQLSLNFLFVTSHLLNFAFFVAFIFSTFLDSRWKTLFERFYLFFFHSFNFVRTAKYSTCNFKFFTSSSFHFLLLKDWKLSIQNVNFPKASSHECKTE